MLTTLNTVKARLGLAAEDVQDDVLLTGLIALVSARFERECDRRFGYAQDDAEEFPGDETELVVSRYPLDAAATIRFDRLSPGEAEWQEVTDVPYVLRGGCVVSLAGPIGRAGDQIRAIYSGGYRLPDGPEGSDGGVPLPDDLQYSAVEQIAYWYQNRDRLGLVSVTAQGGSFRHVGGLDLLPSVAATLRTYLRVVM